MRTKPTTCICGAPIAQKPTGRPRRYCPECGEAVARVQRAVWSRQHRRKTPIRLTTQPEGATHHVR